MMAWRKRLRPASFREVPFFVAESDRGVGINTVVKELIPPEKEPGEFETEALTYVDDLGMSLDEFVIEGYIIANKDNGYDYFPARDDLIKALNTRGPGKLIHPYYGEIWVYHIGKARIRETDAEGGIARFIMTFSQFNELPDPARTVAADSGVDNKVDTNISKADDAIASKVNFSGVHIQSLADSIKDGLQKFVDSIRKIRGTISQYQSEAVGYLSNIIVSIDDVIDSPTDTLDTIKDATQHLLTVVGLGAETIYGGTVGAYTGELRGDVIELNGKSVPDDIGLSFIDGLITAADFGYDSIPWVQEEQINNVKLMLCYLKISLMGVISKIAIRVEYKSQESAEEYQEKIKAAMDDVLLQIGDLVDVDVDENQLYEAMDDLKNSFLSSFAAKIAGISRSVIYTVPADGSCTLLIAYNKYGDIDREQDVYDRNRSLVKHPGFCIGGEDLKVLND